MPDETVIPFDRGKKRRFTRATAGSSEFDLLSFRAPAELIRKMDEIIAARDDPELKTRSDVLNDAFHAWIGNYLESHSETLPRLYDQFVLERLQWTEANRQIDLDLMKERLQVAIKGRHQSVLSVILYNAYRLKNEIESDQYGAPVQLEAVQQIITDTQREMERYSAG